MFLLLLFYLFVLRNNLLNDIFYHGYYTRPYGAVLVSDGNTMVIWYYYYRMIIIPCLSFFKNYVYHAITIILDM